MIYISSNNDRHPVTKTFTPLHYTCRHFTSSHLNFTQLHFSTLSFGLTPFKFPTAPFHLTSLHLTSLHCTFLLGWYTFSSGNSLPTFWDNLSVPSSWVKTYFVMTQKSAVCIYFLVVDWNHGRQHLLTVCFCKFCLCDMLRLS